MKSNKVSIDYFAVTIHDLEVETVIEKILCMPKESFSLENWGFNRYQKHYACSEIAVLFNEEIIEKDNVTIRVFGFGRMGVHILMKGKGCRQYEEFMQGNDNNWRELAQRVRKHGGYATRIDVANDVFNEKLNVQQMYNYAKQGLCICRAKHAKYYEEFELENGEIVGETLTLGKIEGKQQFCVYNKLMEQQEKLSVEEKKEINSWVRAELRACDDKATILLKEIASGTPLTEIFFECINGHYRFVSKNSKDKNKRRRPLAYWWKEYLETKEKTILSIERTKPTMKGTNEWLNKQVSKTLAKTYTANVLAYGTDIAVENLFSMIDKGQSKFSEKDKKEIEQYVKEQQSSKFWGDTFPKETNNLTI